MRAIDNSARSFPVLLVRLLFLSIKSNWKTPNSSVVVLAKLVIEELVKAYPQVIFPVYGRIKLYNFDWMIDLLVYWLKMMILLPYYDSACFDQGLKR